MRILCCLNRDLVSSYALNLLLPSLEAHEVWVGLSERIGPAGALVAEPRGRTMLRTAEQTFANEVAFPLIDRAAFPDDGERHLTFAELERHRGIRVSSLQHPNSAEGLAAIEEFAPDLILSIRYGAILKEAVIAVPRFGVLNLHAGVLPNLRGVIASFRALLAGHAEVGCTLHYITDGTIDTGPIVAVARLPVRAEESLLWHVLALYPPGIQLVRAAIEELERGRRPVTTPQSGGAYFSYPTSDEWTEFTRRGWPIATPGDLQAAIRRYMPTQS
jgi:methionyl-tRNA formyltransferase